MHPDDRRIWDITESKADTRSRKKIKGLEDFQTIDAVIDLSTRKEIEKLQSKRILKAITGTIASGKESGVFLAQLGDEGENLCAPLSIESPIIVKIYRTSTLNFKRISHYIVGDHRFYKHSKKSRDIVKLWAEKEYRNLLRSSSKGIPTPKPILVRRNLVLMELLGENGQPYPLLKKTPHGFTDATLTQIIKQIKNLFWQAELVHADLSPYNILMGPKIPYFIDMSQSVVTTHPNAINFLKRDLDNILTSFSQKNVEVPSHEDLLYEILEEKSIKE